MPEDHIFVQVSDFSYDYRRQFVISRTAVVMEESRSYAVDLIVLIKIHLLTFIPRSSVRLAGWSPLFAKTEHSVPLTL